MPVRKLLFALLGLGSIAALAILLWAPLLSSMFPDLDISALGGVARVRLAAAGALVAFLILRAFLQPPKAPSRQSIVWAEFASTVGTKVVLERRGLGPVGWTGGPTVRWDARGTEITLATLKDADRNWDTHLTASVRMARPFQFHAVHQNMLTKVLFSRQLWSVALRAVRERERASTGGSSASESIAFLAQPEILTGDPKLDEDFLIKTDVPDLARTFFVDPGVSSALHAMDEMVKGWQLSLMARSDDEHQITLVIPGSMEEPRHLEACRTLVEASIRCLTDRGFLHAMRTRAA